MKVIIIMHDESEGPGTIEDFLAARKAQLHFVRLYAGENLPNIQNKFDGVISMGGPMNVYEDEKYPFLREEAIFLKQAIDQGIPTLGICLGAQLIARACGAKVNKAQQKEIGWSDITFTEAGQNDPLFWGLPPTIPVFQWHEDTFEIPEGGQLLATSIACTNQAFRYGNAYGLQFHIEVTPKMIADWFSSSPEGKRVLQQMEKIEVEFIRQALIIYHNFFKLLRKKRAFFRSGR